MVHAEELLKLLKLGKDDTFAFGCTKCGKCCRERADILLTPLDLFKISKYLNQSIREVLTEYCEHNTILNHTDLYEYKHGKMLLHMKFHFECIPTNQSPAELLKYYRLRKGLTTRQLAEVVGIVPSTVRMYEQEQFQIPYQTAVTMADVLEIDKILLFDDFARFLDAPHSAVIRRVRSTYKLSQKDFAEKAGITFNIYAKWESGARQPSRKMYDQLVDKFPEIKI